MPDNDVKKSAMFVFKDMEEFKTRGKDENGDLVILSLIHISEPTRP